MTVAKKPIRKAVKKKTSFKNSVKGKTEPKVSRGYVTFSIITMAAEALVIIVLGMALTIANSGPKYTIDKDGNVVKVRQDKAVKNGKIVAGDHIEGKKDSDVVFIWYVDMQCPACASMAPIVQTLYEKYGDSVAFVTRNFLITGHNYARSAAYAVEAAGDQGYYWDMMMATFSERQNWAYVNNESLLRERLAEIFMEVSDGNGNKERFLADMTSDKYESKIDSDEKLVRQDDLSGTPTIIINGKSIDFTESKESPVYMFAEELDKALGKE